MLRPSLQYSPFLFVTTDAHMEHTSGLQPAGAGLGRVFSDGVEVQHVSVGFWCIAASSSILEWLSKFLAL